MKLGTNEFFFNRWLRILREILKIQNDEEKFDKFVILMDSLLEQNFQIQNGRCNMLARNSIVKNLWNWQIDMKLSDRKLFGIAEQKFHKKYKLTRFSKFIASVFLNHAISEIR